MKTLKETRRIGLGCMNVSHAYGPRPGEADAVRLINEALDAGYDHLDTAALYGGGKNEALLGKAVMHRRSEFCLASKCGLFLNEEGKKTLDGRPETIRRLCEASLKRLGTEVIDLYYLHRLDPNVPIEESVGTMGDLVREGKVRELGLSEVSARTLRRAHAEHPIAAVQTEYSLWTRNAEIAVIPACEELGITFVAFSPLARGYLGGELTDLSHLPETDIRLKMPRFSAENYPKNLALLEPMRNLAESLDVTPAQLALAWMLHRSPSIVAIPGTTRTAHMKDNLAAEAVTLNDDIAGQLDDLINTRTVYGPRYATAQFSEIDTERCEGEPA